MDQIIKSIADGYTQQMDSYTGEDPELIREIEEWKADVYRLAEKHTDPNDFSQTMVQGPLFSRMTDLMYRISMADYMKNQETDAGEGGENSRQSDSPAPLPTIREFVDQYRPGYDEIRKARYRVRTIKAYEDVFAVADRTDSLLEGQLILEREGLLRKMTAINGREVGESLLEAMDPLFDATIATTEELVKAYRDFLCPEEVVYRGELIAYNAARRVAMGQAYIWLGTMWSLLTMEYQIGKEKLRHWHNDIDAKNGYQLMVTRRGRMRQLYKAMEQVLGMTWDEMMDREFIKNQMLGPAGLDDFWRCKYTLPPENLVAIEEIVREEVMSDMTIPQILQREQKAVLAGSPKGSQHDQIVEEFQQLAKERNSNIPYFQYMEQLSEEEKAAFKQEGRAVAPERKRKGGILGNLSDKISDMSAGTGNFGSGGVGAISRGLGKLFGKK